MINYHPDQHMLSLHAKGELPLSMSIAISAHAEFCQHCQQQLDQMTIAMSEQQFESAVAPQFANSKDNDQLDALLSQLLNSTLDTLAAEQPTNIDKTEDNSVNIKGQHYSLPRAFRNQINASWQGIGKVSRLRLDTGEPQARASLLHIAANGEIPEHTHKGAELTLLLAGEFSDCYNTYKPGDFMLLDKAHQHSPKTIDGCLCYTVVDAPLYFTKGISKLLNPIGDLIY
ncbi:anti-sigma factor [Shewanella vesiculosa]|uniref:ChrR family anti-sigma-E factor n=1 Tax=Shewanella TaxID=22 RepID=UPI000F5083BE|nr:MULTISPECIES: ChrR family anti-sigma-E factor [Shewanella]MBB1389174.1 cupin domain-containing protein [Shewanella sp. SG44-6]MBB1476725.1 cupin domain-containing protein [Shewanella sp. SG41-3]RPA55328.1 anti-sigma factor [Shewanella vesiculosa]UJL43357.1 cupin domain-containing protein [Shewanella vesiculosa]